MIEYGNFIVMSICIAAIGVAICVGIGVIVVTSVKDWLRDR